jgi:N-methylhydantoinase A/oxoprolinase/acetone carboxylase beta subunit
VLRTTAAADDTAVLAAFGGAGPLVACAIAEQAGLSRVIIPRLAAVFSAFGIGFSDVGHEFAQLVGTAAEVTDVRRQLLAQARRAMYAEGAELDACHVEESIDQEGTSAATLTVRVVKPVPHARMSGRFGVENHEAKTSDHRTVLCGGQRRRLPLYRVEDQRAGSRASGPAVLEEAYFTCRVDHGWQFEINDSGDILLSRDTGGRP